MTVQTSTLSNGIRIVTSCNENVETVTLGAWFDVGTRDETPEVNGISHFLEHMAFKGTETRTAKDIAEAIEDVGGYLNAYTSREVTAYHFRVLKEHTELAVELLADILQRSTFQDEEFKKEQMVILQEISQTYDTPDDIIFDYFQETAFPNQPMGWPILGTSDIIKSLKSPAVKNYMTSHYGSEKLVIAAAGKVSHDAFHKFCEQRFSQFKKSDVQKREPSAYKGGEFLQERTLEQTHTILGFEGISFHSPTYYDVMLLSMILGGGMSSRLFQEIREKRGLVYSIYAFSSSYKDSGLFTIYGGTSPEQVTEMLPAITTELKKVTEDVSIKELDRAKAQLKAGLLMGLESSSARCEQIAKHTLIHGRVIPTKELIEKVDAVSVQGVQEAATKIFTGKPTLTILGPLKNVPSYGSLFN